MTTRSILRKADGKVTIRVQLGDGKRVQHNELERSAADSLARSLVDFAGLDQRFGELEVTSKKIQPGTYQLGGRKFAARRVALAIETTLLSRGVDYPLTIEIDCIQADAVAMTGVIEAKYRFLLHRRNGSGSTAG